MYVVMHFPLKKKLFISILLDIYAQCFPLSISLYEITKKSLKYCRFCPKYLCVKISSAYSKLTRFLDALIFEHFQNLSYRIFSKISSAYFKLTRFLGALIFKSRHIWVTLIFKPCLFLEIIFFRISEFYFYHPFSV